MPLESVGHLMQRCREGRYALGYFESWNLESLQGVLDAAEQTRSPVVIGFNGDFLSDTDASHRSVWDFMGQWARRRPSRRKCPAL